MPLSLSSGDWIRMQKLKNARRYASTISSNEDILNNVTRGNPFSPQTDVSRIAGSSKIRREASKWIDFIASQKETTLQQSVNYQYSAASVFTGTRLTSTKLCSCTSTTLQPKQTTCIKCK
jgi:hypothetical protein